MVIEHGANYIKQILREDASRITSEAAELLRQGKQDEALAKMDEARGIIGKTQKVDDLTNTYLSSLQELGLEQPSLESFQSAAVVDAPRLPAPVGGETLGKEQIQSRPHNVELRISEPVPTTPIAAQPKIIQETLPATPQTKTLNTSEFTDTTNQNTATLEMAYPFPDLVRESESRSRRDFNLREERTVYALFAINKEKTDFAFKSIEDIAKFVYEDYDESGPIRSRRKFAVSSQRPNIALKLQDIEADPTMIPPYISRFLGWLAGQVEYESLEIEDLAKIARGTMSFQEILTKVADQQTKSVLALEHQEDALEVQTGDSVGGVFDGRESEVLVSEPPLEIAGIGPKEPEDGKNGAVITDGAGFSADGNIVEDVNVQAREDEEEAGVDPKLNNAEVLELAKLLKGADQELLETIGIIVQEEDINEFSAILERSFSTPELEAEASKLKRKLESFLQDRQKVFTENIENEDAQFLLAFFATVNSVQDIGKLFGN